MDSARPLREVFADLTGAGNAGDARELLGGQGHAGLPDELVAEAVVNFADTAPIEVAEHLAPFVTAHSAVGADEVAGADETAGDEGWLDLMVTAPTGTDADELDDVPPGDELGEDAGTGLDADSAFDVDFGAGADAAGTDAVADDDAEWTPSVETTAADDLDPSDLDDATNDIGADGADGVDGVDGVDGLDDDDEPDIGDVG